jgi:hypothetical protein
MKNKFIITNLLLTFIISLFSCKKFVSISPPKTQVETKLIFDNDQAAVSAVVGLYSQMMQATMAITNGAATLYPALSSDELSNTSANADYDAFRTNQVVFSSSTGLTRLWTQG